VNGKQKKNDARFKPHVTHEETCRWIFKGKCTRKEYSFVLQFVGILFRFSCLLSPSLSFMPPSVSVQSCFSTVDTVSSTACFVSHRQYNEDNRLPPSTPHSAVSTDTRYGMNGPGIESRCGWVSPRPSRPTLGPTQPPIQWVPGYSRG
jgi:hypothetical protein